ncbi:MAG TPA: hypothetical protein EYQ50_13600 [Verrucomicrobiales bacterium]|nr:hypothetical protein [Verrucomicrobiales bacterium]HIL69908.1 hypothetical protein [Verrucomicrobiota bacterium]
MRTKQDGIHAAQQAIHEYQRQINDLQNERRRIQASVEQVGEQLNQTLSDLAKGLLPSNERRPVERAANETGALHLPTALAELEQKRIDSVDEISTIEASENYINRELLVHSVTGEYSLKINEAEETVGAFKAVDEEYDFKEFQWLYEREHHKEKQHGGFKKFWRAVSMASKREAKAETVVLEKLNAASFIGCVERYEQNLENVEQAENELQSWKDKKQGVIDQVERRDFLKAWVENYPMESVSELRNQLSRHLCNCHYQELHDTIRPAGKVMVSKCHALSKKTEYFHDMIRSMDNEIADRQKRIESISRVKQKWSYKPYGPMRGDKTKWLCELPEMKRRSTAKRLNWTQTMHHNVHGYDRYDNYDAFMTAGVVFLAYDAFSYRADERMPYEGYSRTIISDLDGFRNEHDQDSADYGIFKESINDYEDTDEGWDDSSDEEAMDSADAAMAEELELGDQVSMEDES